MKKESNIKKKPKEKKLHDFGLKKLTTSQLLNASKKENKKLKFRIGELISEIDELKYENELLKKKELKALKSDLSKTDIIYQELRNKIKDLEKKLSSLKKDKDSLICRITQLQINNEGIK